MGTVTVSGNSLRLFAGMVTRGGICVIQQASPMHGAVGVRYTSPDVGPVSPRTAAISAVALDDETFATRSWSFWLAPGARVREKYEVPGVDGPAVNGIVEVAAHALGAATASRRRRAVVTPAPTVRVRRNIAISSLCEADSNGGCVYAGIGVCGERHDGWIVNRDATGTGARRGGIQRNQGCG